MQKLIYLIFLLSFLVGCASKEISSKKSESNIRPNAGLSVAVVNLKIEGGGTVDSLTDRMEGFVKNAKRRGAKYILFPELTTLDLLSRNPSDQDLAKELITMAKTKNLYEKRLKSLALNNKITIIGANHYVLTPKNKFLNRAYIVKPDGSLYYQDKIYPTPWEVRQGVIGGKKTNKFEWEDFSFVVLTCHDAEFPNLSLELAKLKPEIIFVPSMTDDLNGLQRVKRTSQARSIEHMSYVLMTGASSKRGAKWHTYQGRSFLFTPQNKYFSEPEGGALEEGLKIFHLDLPSLRKARKDQKQVYPSRDLKLGS